MKHIISLLMENEAGALSRVAGLFSARAYNIESLTVAPTEDATLSRMTIVTSGSDDVIEQIDRIRGDCVGVQALGQRNRALLERPHVDAAVGPVCEHQVQGTTRCAQVVARAQL